MTKLQLNSFQDIADELAIMRHDQRAAAVKVQLLQVERSLREFIYTKNPEILSGIPLLLRRSANFTSDPKVQKLVNKVSARVRPIIKQTHKNVF